jgi:hypothetical protein
MERKLRDDAAALEEAKRLERARIEEKLRKEKAQQEAEVCSSGLDSCKKQPIFFSSDIFATTINC